MKILVAGAGGFIGGHLVARLINDGHEVRGIDIKPMSDWFQVHTKASNHQADLSLLEEAMQASKGIDWVYNLAADMGGMGFIENNKAKCMLSVLINTHLLEAAKFSGVTRFFYASSACVYPSWLQADEGNLTYLKESDAYPADPEDGYGWEKLFSERMCRHYEEDFGLQVRIGRYHNVYGPLGTYDGGREKAPAAACRKIAELKSNKLREISIWGNGQQIRTFTYIDDCVEGTVRLMNSDYSLPLNIGSDEAVTINSLYEIIAQHAGLTSVTYTHDLTAPQGVRGRASNNELIKKTLGWSPVTKLRDGLLITYQWIESETSKLG